MNPPPVISIAPEGQKILDKASQTIAVEYTRLAQSLVKRTSIFNSYKGLYDQDKIPQNLAIVLVPQQWPSSIPSNLTDALHAKEQLLFKASLRSILEGRLAFLSADVINLQTQLASFTSDEEISNKFFTIIPTLINQPSYLPLLIWSFRLVKTRQDALCQRALQKALKIRFAPSTVDMTIEEDAFVDMTNEDTVNTVQNSTNRNHHRNVTQTSSSSSSSSSTSLASPTNTTLATSTTLKKKGQLPTVTKESELSILTQQVAELTKTVAVLQTKFTGSPLNGAREPSPSRHFPQLPSDTVIPKSRKKKNNTIIPQQKEVQVTTTIHKPPTPPIPYLPSQYLHFPMGTMIPQQQHPLQQYPQQQYSQLYQNTYMPTVGHYNHLGQPMTHFQSQQLQQPLQPFMMQGRDCQGFVKHNA